MCRQRPQSLEPTHMRGLTGKSWTNPSFLVSRLKWSKHVVFRIERDKRMAGSLVRVSSEALLLEGSQRAQTAGQVLENDPRQQARSELLSRGPHALRCSNRYKWIQPLYQCGLPNRAFSVSKDCPAHEAERHGQDPHLLSRSKNQDKPPDLSVENQVKFFLWSRWPGYLAKLMVKLGTSSSHKAQGGQVACPGYIAS